MTTMTSTTDSLPSLGLFALALTLLAYCLDQTGMVIPPSGSMAIVLLLGGGLQLLVGLQTRNPYAGGTLLPLGLFWLSLVGFEVFPELGFGHHPRPVVMVSYLGMWGLFAAILFLASFRQSRALQLLFGALTISLLLLALGKFNNSPVFLISGGSAGILSALAAGYTALAQLCNQGAGRAILPLGYWEKRIEDAQERQLVR